MRARLDRLEPSPVLTPTHDAQLRRLGRARSLALELVGAIGAEDAERVARLLRSFRATGGSDPRREALGRGAAVGSGGARARPAGS